VGQFRKPAIRRTLKSAGVTLRVTPALEGRIRARRVLAMLAARLV
jgi:hypothetical protein